MGKIAFLVSKFWRFLFCYVHKVLKICFLRSAVLPSIPHLYLDFLIPLTYFSVSVNVNSTPTNFSLVCVLSWKRSSVYYFLEFTGPSLLQCLKTLFQYSPLALTCKLDLAESPSSFDCYFVWPTTHLPVSSY